MAGSNFVESKNAPDNRSLSPRTSASLSNQGKKSMKEKSGNQTSPVPHIRGSKRRHHHIESPNTTSSQKSKIPSLFEIPIIPFNVVFTPSNLSKSSSSSSVTSSSSNRSTPIRGYSTPPLVQCDDSSAVPVVSVIPPMPCQLPSPPSCWVNGGRRISKVTTICRQECKTVTKDLMSHLTSTGILIASS